MSYHTSQQPGPTMGMHPGGGNRNALSKPLDSHGKREWSHGLCDCCGACGTFCYSWWCPCIVHGKNKQRLRHLIDRGSPEPDGGSCCSGTCWGYCCLTSFTGLGFILQMMNRGDVRSRYSIEGGGCGDCLASCCCGPCELTQTSREIELEEQSFGKQY
ncbi:PLAC8 family-domain-containing protein [Mycena rebaudengoi]|nr:PLAC8 family-domain-containing protein [Mycena rebaudengoi]